jgi:hypothetical protein
MPTPLASASAGGEAGRLIVEEDLATGRRLIAGRDLHEGTLARAVLADEGHDLPAPGSG